MHSSRNVASPETLVVPESPELSESSDEGRSQKKSRKLISDGHNFHAWQDQMNESHRSKKVKVNVNKGDENGMEKHRLFLNANLYPSK